MNLPLNRYLAPQYHDLLWRTPNPFIRQPEPEPAERFGRSLFRVYKDHCGPSAPLQFKGDSYMDIGYFYCPYPVLTAQPQIAS